VGVAREDGEAGDLQAGDLLDEGGADRAPAAVGFHPLAVPVEHVGGPQALGALRGALVLTGPIRIFLAAAPAAASTAP